MNDNSMERAGSVDRVVAIVTNVDAIAAVRELVSAASEYGRVREQEQTKRAVIAATERAFVARIHSAETVLRDYFERAFAERAKVSEEMFARLDHALESGDPQLVHAVVRGVVDLAQASPLAGLEDFGKFWAQLGTPDEPIQL